MNKTSALPVFFRGMRLILSGNGISPKDRIGESITLERNGKKKEGTNEKGPGYFRKSAPHGQHL